MRIRVIILLVMLLGLAKVEAQTITLAGNNLPLLTVFSEIKKQTGYFVVTNRQLLKKANPVSVSAKNQPLEEFLKTIFRNQPFEYIIRGKNISIKEKSGSPPAVNSRSATNNLDTARKITIQGRIINEKGDPIVATITIRGTNNATSTNANGEFVLKQVENNAMLVVSGINIESYEVRINGNADLKNITVKTKIKEEETVVIANTGYQKLKPNEITGSITVIDNKTLNQQTGTNIIDRLNGVTPGMLFNVGKNKADGTPNLYSIRGLSTIEGDVSPLIILDNFEYDGDINNINPGDVDNITILKDAAAASIYGARGGNGVIVITTKRGRFNQKLKVEFNADMIVTQKPDLYAIPQLSPAEYVGLEEFFFSKGVDFGASNSASSSISPVINILVKRKAGIISPADSASQIDALKQIDNRKDLNKYFYQNAVTRQYSLNLRGGSNNLAWFLSGSYDKGITSLDGKSDKINVNLRNEYKPLKNLNISFSAYYTNASIETGKTIESTYRKSLYVNYADENGMPLSVSSKKDKFLDTIGDGHLLSWKNFPLEDYKHDKTTTQREQLVAGVETRYAILKGLDLSLSYQYQREWGGSERYADIESYYTRNLINGFTKLSRSSTPDTFYIPKGGILEVETGSEHSYSFRAQLGFQREWQQRKYAVNTILAVERREAIIDPTNKYTLYGYNKDPLIYGVVNFAGEYPDFLTGAANSIQGAPSTGPVISNRFISLLGNITYTFKERYSLSASARKDAANVFGLSTNDKWTPLWSIGMAWDMSAENFYYFKPIPHLKWRVTYGYSGNVDVSRTALTILSYNTGFTTPYGTPYADPSRKNPDLRWEKKRDLNIALEFATKGNAISGSIEYYQKKCTDLYGQTLVDYTTYTPFRRSTIAANVANMKGNGLDITINSKNVDKTIKWNTSLLFNYSRDIVTDYLSPSAQNGSGLIGDYGGAFLIPVVGKPLYAIAAYKWGGLDSAGNPQGYYQGKLSSNYAILGNEINDGITSTSIDYIGPSNPPYFGSLINQFSWKGLSASFNIAYKFSYYFRKPVFSQVLWRVDGTGYGDFSRRWQKTGDELITNVPALLAPNTIGIDSRDQFYQYAAINVLRADHIRLQYINLAYSFTRHQKKFLFSYMQIYFNAANLGILWRANKENIDPDYPNIIPPSRSFTVGWRGNL